MPRITTELKEYLYTQIAYGKFVCIVTKSEIQIEVQYNEWSRLKSDDNYMAADYLHKKIKKAPLGGVCRAVVVLG